jgi:hypothetical protein
MYPMVQIRALYLDRDIRSAHFLLSTAEVIYLNFLHCLYCVFSFNSCVLFQGLTQSMSHLPLGSDLKILKQHRSLYKEEKIRNDYQNTEDVQTRRLGQSQSEASLDKDIAKLKEIEHYRTAEYMNESLKILTFDELVTKKAAQDRKNDVFKKQMVRERSRAAARDMSQVSSDFLSHILCLIISSYVLLSKKTLNDLCHHLISLSVE